MNWLVTLYAALLFFALSPNVLLRLPPKGDKFLVAGVHAIIFALIFHFTYKMVWQVSVGGEGFKEGVAACAKAGQSCANKTCCGTLTCRRSKGSTCG
jgi:hypothetical protein